MKQFALSLTTIALLWSLSSWGYFWLLGPLQADIGYNDAPVVFTIYYGVWAAVAYLIGYAPLRDWSNRHLPNEDRRLFAVLALAFIVFSVVALPQLPQINPDLVGADEDLASATSIYFLPKTAEILFQQILVSVMVITLARQQTSITRISLVVAALFGGFHVALALNGYNGFYVFRYTVAATLFGALAPYLMLRTVNGFIACFGIHWGFYALDATISHFVLSGVLATPAPS